jgi:hypothetical protein
MILFYLFNIINHITKLLNISSSVFCYRIKINIDEKYILALCYISNLNITIFHSFDNCMNYMLLYIYVRISKPYYLYEKYLDTWFSIWVGIRTYRNFQSPNRKNCLLSFGQNCIASYHGLNITCQCVYVLCWYLNRSTNSITD